MNTEEEERIERIKPEDPRRADKEHTNEQQKNSDFPSFLIIDFAASRI